MNKKALEAVSILKHFFEEKYKSIVFVSSLIIATLLSTLVLYFYANSSINRLASFGLLLLIFGLFFSGVWMLFGKQWFENKKHIGIISVCFVSFIYCFFTFNKTAPISEGWYTTYAQLILSGKRPYADFDFLFTPSYLYFVTIIIGLFGPKIIFMRIVGVYFLIIMAVVVYKIIERFVDPLIAVFITFAFILFMQSNNTAFFYFDYVDFYNIWNFLGLYFLVRYFTADIGSQKFIVKSRFNLNLCFSGVSICISALCRQSSGLIMLVFGLCAIIFGTILLKRKPLFSSLSYILGVTISGLIVLSPVIFSGSLIPFLRLVGPDAVSAKGGLWQALFGWVPGIFTTYIVVSALVFTALFFIFYYLLNARKKNNQATIIKGTVFGIILFALVITMYIMNRSNTFNAIFTSLDPRQMMNPFYVISIFVFVVSSIILLIQGIKKAEIDSQLILLMLLSGYAAFTQFGCCTSASTSEGQAILTVCLAFVLIPICVKKFSFSSLIFIVNSTLAVIFGLSATSISFAYTYSWWGIGQGSIYIQNRKANVNLFDGIEMTDTTKYLYEGVYYHVIRDYVDGDEVYCFPHIPIFYNVLGVEPMKDLRAPVAWFDVSSDSGLIHDYDLISRRTPKFIVYADLPEGVIGGHEYSFNGGKRSIQRDFLELFNGWRNGGLYSEVYSYNANAGISEEYMIRVLEINPTVKAERDEWVKNGLEKYFDFYMAHKNERFIYFGNDFITSHLSNYWIDGRSGIAERDYNNPLALYKAMALWNPQWFYLDNASIHLEKYSHIVKILNTYCKNIVDWPNGILYEWNKNIQTTFVTHESTFDEYYGDGWVTPYYIQTDYVEKAKKVEIEIYYPANRQIIDVTLCVDGQTFDNTYDCGDNGYLAKYECNLDEDLPYHTFALISKPRVEPKSEDLRPLGAVLSSVNYIVS